MKAKFKRGDYAKANRGNDIYYVLGSSAHNGVEVLELECLYSGNSYDACEARFYTKCRKPLSYNQELSKLKTKYAIESSMKVMADHKGRRRMMQEFHDKVVELLKKHGHKIHIQGE